jgi:hypothetical protein
MHARIPAQVGIERVRAWKKFSEFDDSIDFDQGSNFMIAIASDGPLMLLREIG